MSDITDVRIEQVEGIWVVFGEGRYPHDPPRPASGLEIALHGQLQAVLGWQVIRHPLPWRVESDWTEEVVASDGYCIAKCDFPEQAEAIVALASPRTDQTKEDR